MRLNYHETKSLIELVLEGSSEDARTRLYQRLKYIQRTEAEFYAGIVEHASGMSLSSQKWYELLSRLPNRILSSQLELKNLRSDVEISKLPRL
jgi:hypothetical protein